MDKQILGIISVALVFFGYAIYFRSIVRRETKPHMFSWITWTLVDGIMVAGLVASGAGAGSWSFVAITLFCGIVTGLSFVYGDRNITRSDWIAFTVALASIPLWVLTKDPLAALALVTAIDIVGSYPTFRKTYVDPYGENLFSWIVHGIRSFVVLLALETYSVATLIAPLGLMFVCVGIPTIIVVRRHVLGQKRSLVVEER